MDFDNSDRESVLSNSDLDYDSDIDDNNQVQDAVNWGSSKRSYYFTDYVDQDFPTKLDSKKAKEAEEEEVEALKIQKRLLSTVDYDQINDTLCLEKETRVTEKLTDLLSQIKKKNQDKKKSDRSLEQQPSKKVKFTDQDESKREEEQIEQGLVRSQKKDKKAEDQNNHNQRRPINKAIEKNRGLTPYRKKDYRNPRVRHRNKFNKAMSKRRHMVQEAQKEWTRYSGEATGIKTSTIRSIKFT